MSSAAVETLLEVLGGAIRREEAEQLLSATGGDIEAAVAAHFSALSDRPSRSTGTGQNASSPVANLRSILGPAPPDSQLNELLRISGGSIEVAVDMYLEDPNTGASSAAAGGAGASGSAAPRTAAAGTAAAGAGRSAHRTQAGSNAAAPAADGDLGLSPGRRRSNRSSMGRPAQQVPSAVGAPRENGANGDAVAVAGPGSATAGGEGSAGGVAARPSAGGAAARGDARGTGAAASAAAGGGAAGAGTGAAGGAQQPQGQAGGGVSSGLPPRAPRAAAQEPGAAMRAGAGTSTAGGSQGQQPPQQVPGAPAGQQQGTGATAVRPPSGAAAAGGRSATTPTVTAGTAAGTAGAAAGTAGAAATGTGPGPSRVAAGVPAPARRPYPLLDGNLIASVKRTQGPYPVAPLLPLPQYRRPDGSLYLANQNEVPDRSSPTPALSSLKWPMALGRVSVPLEFDTRGGWMLTMHTGRTVAASRMVLVSTETQKVLLGMALDWLVQGKLATAAAAGPAPPAASGRAKARAQPSTVQEADVSWAVEEVEAECPLRAAPDAPLQLRPGGSRLALCVSNRDFLRAAASRFPDDMRLRQAAHSSDGTYIRLLRLGTTPLEEGSHQKLVRLYRTSVAEFNSGPGSAVLTNVRILGPGLDSLKGVALRDDVTAACRRSSSSSASDSDSDHDGEGPRGGAGAAGAHSDSDQESDAEDGAGAASAGGKQKLAGRKRGRAAKGRARSRGGGGDAAAANAAAASAKSRDNSRSKDAGAKRPGKNAQVHGGGAAAKRVEEEEDTVASPSPRARKRSRRAGPAPPGAGRTTSPGAPAAAGSAGRGTAGASLPAAGARTGAGGAAAPAAAAVAGSGAAADAPFQLSLEFFLTAEGLKSTSPPSSWSDEESASDSSRKAANSAARKGEHLATIVHVLLEVGSGLYVGPDCDGAINTMDVAAVSGGRAQGRDGGGAGACTSAGSTGAAENGARSRGVSTAGAASGAPGTSGADAGAGFDGDEEDGEGVRNLDALLDSIRPPSDLPQALVPRAVVAHPKPFQLQGLEWMRRREQRGDAVGRSLLLLHPAWIQVVLGSSGLVLHVHRIAPYFVSADFFPAPVGGTCGGFLCDEMGLGKSLQTLMLIVSNPSPPGWAATPVVVKQARSGDRPAHTALVDPGGTEPVAIPTTLLVTPANLQGQWVEEIQRHLQPGSLKWAIYRGRDAADGQPGMEELDADGAAAAHDGAAEDSLYAKRRVARITRELGITMKDGPGGSKAGRFLPAALADTENGRMVPLHECDVVLVSYEVLRKELSGRSSNSMPLLRLGFWRIVLDEAQLVANSNSVAAQVVSSLYRRHAWVVTGTPISSSLNEVQGMCEFLSYEPFYHSSMWRSLIQQPYGQHGRMGAAAFRALLRGVMLRRSKAAVEDQLALPPCTRQELAVELSGVERAYYDVAKGRFLAALAAIKAGNPGPGGGAGAGGTAGAGPSTSGPGGAAEPPPPQQGRRGRPNRQALDDSRRPAALHSRANTALVELRQCCCHPQIVRREAEATGCGRGGRGGGAAAGGGGPVRLSMRQIMAKMVSEAYSAYDQAVAVLYGCKMQLAALEDLRGGGGGADGSGATGSGANGSGANGSGADANGGSEGAAGRTPQLPVLLESIRSVMKLVSEPDLLNQAKARGPDGAVNLELAGRTAAYGGVSGGLASVAPLTAAEQAKDRKRRWMRLEADGLMLRCYIACLQAPYGTLQLLAAQANARVMAQAHQEAIAKAQRAEDAASHRAAALVEAQACLDAAKEEVLREKDTGGGPAAAEGTGKGGKKRRADGGGGAVAEEDMTEAEKDCKRAKERLAAAKRAAADSVQSVEAAKAAVAVAEAEAMGADAAAAAALAAAPPEVAAAAEAVHALNEELREVRGKLGVEHVDFEVAETALRRSSRQQMELAVGGTGGAAAAGPSNGAAAALAAAAAAAAAGSSPNAYDSDDGDWRDGGSDSSDSSDDGGRRRGRQRMGVKRGRASNELVGGFARKRGRKPGPKDRDTGGGGRGGGDGGGTSGLLRALGGTEYQEAVFRSEVAVRTFQSVTTRRKRGAGETAEETRPLQAVREKWHDLQHLINQQAELGLADDAADEGAAAAAAPGDGPETGGAGPSDSGCANGAAASPQTLHQRQQNQLMSQQLLQLLGQRNQQQANPQNPQQQSQQQSAAPGPEGGGSGLGRGGAAAGAGPSELCREAMSCPICLESIFPSEQSTITKCGHTFCTDCIHGIVQDKGTAPCPICRRQLARTDLFDSVPEHEAEQDVAVLPQLGNADYGAKVSALLDELARMSAEDPGSKALVFSSWGRLLRLVQDALLANGVRCVSMVGSNPEARQSALQSFLHDPTCRVLLLMKSTSGGAAGLTLTVAHTAFMMEPAMNPGLEAQAAARICRLGQDRPTRVVRIIAKNTVEERVLAVQQHKQQLGESVPGGEIATEAVDGSLLLRFFDRL